MEKKSSFYRRNKVNTLLSHIQTMKIDTVFGAGPFGIRGKTLNQKKVFRERKN